MKIKKYKIQLARLSLKEPFQTSLGITYFKDVVILTIITDQHITGIGEASPSTGITGENVWSCLGALIKYLLPAVKNQSVFDLEKVHFLMDKAIIGNTSAKAAVDIAIYDALSKQKGISLAEYLGAEKNKITTDITISINSPSDMAEKAIELSKKGFKILKLKVGTDYKKDILRIKAVRKAVGDNIKIRVDANQGWDNITQATKAITAMEKYNIELVEQPLKWFDLKGLAKLRKLVSTPIALDESVHSLIDLQRVIDLKAADILNIKLMKTGGIYPAIKIIQTAKKHNIPCMIGGMLESEIAVTAAIGLGLSQSNIKYADLDADLLLKEKITTSGGADIVNGDRIVSKKPGLGINKIRKDAVQNIAELMHSFSRYSTTYGGV